MSFTMTSNMNSTLYTPPSILLSPSKRKRDVKPEVKSTSNLSNSEIWAWTLTSEALAPCTVRDVFSMKGPAEGYDFYWLGRIPCRTVKLVGLLVGMQAYEKRNVYTLDDGTSVIDCIQRSTPKSKPLKSPKDEGIEPLLLPNPVANIGDFVEAVGKILRRHNTWQIVIESIARCKSLNDELNHLRKVRALHTSYYFATEQFIIPDQKNLRQKQKPQTHQHDLVEPNVSAPSSTVSSPTKSESKFSIDSPHKFRHPSRLKARDLTANSFRMYLKHYMEQTVDMSLEGTNAIFAYTQMSGNFSTPTKNSKSLDETPRATRFFRKQDSPSSHRTQDMHGYTLSHLRRVPELNLMAKRVVIAEAERRFQLAERKTAGKRSQKLRKPCELNLDRDRLSSKMKRLFQWAIVQLYQDGDVILLEKPGQSVSGHAGPAFNANWSGMDSLSLSASGMNTTIFSSTSQHVKPSWEDDFDEGDLSDPGPNEEAYVAMTTHIVTLQVEKAIQELSLAFSKAQTKMANFRLPLFGATKEDILDHIRKDDRWCHIGLWNIGEALELLKEEGKVWCVGKGKWDLTL